MITTRWYLHNLQDNNEKRDEIKKIIEDNTKMGRAFYEPCDSDYIEFYVCFPRLHEAYELFAKIKDFGDLQVHDYTDYADLFGEENEGYEEND